MSLIFRLLVSLLIGFSTICVSPSHALRLQCADIPVAFDFETPDNLKCLCDTMKTAVTFLKSIGLQAEDVVTIKIMDHLPLQQMHDAVGYYHAGSREVYILNYSRVAEGIQVGRPLLDKQLSEEIWCSYAAHELAHAISSHQIQKTTDKHLAGEYISVVTQFAVLSPGTREMVLKNYSDVEAYKSTAEMSSLYYQFAPNEFAVKCYLHFSSLEKPKEFIKKLVHAEVEFGNGY